MLLIEKNLWKKNNENDNIKNKDNDYNKDKNNGYANNYGKFDGYYKLNNIYFN